MQQSFVTFAQRSLELMALTYALVAYAAANKNHRRYLMELAEII